MNLHWIDWTIMIVAVVALRLVSLSTRRYMRGVSDFLAANRLAGRYLLTIAQEMGSFGVVSFVAIFERLMSAGLAPDWWGGFQIPMGVIILLTGWVSMATGVSPVSATRPEPGEDTRSGEKRHPELDSGPTSPAFWIPDQVRNDVNLCYRDGCLTCHCDKAGAG